MNNIPNELLINITYYCDWRALLQLLKVSKWTNSICTKNTLWTKIGQRDHPLLDIYSLVSYVYNNPMCVTSDELEYYIQGNLWAQTWINKKKINYNGVYEHRYPVYVRSIVRKIIRVEKWKRLKDRHPEQPQDWKISVNIIIEDLLKKSEDENKELSTLKP